MNSSFWKDKKVLLTGHTGFKGSWLSLWLQARGARLVGYALPPDTEPSMFKLARVSEGMESIFEDICDMDKLLAVFSKHRPEIVIHLAAKPLVRYSYQNPVETYRTNVGGTVRVLDAIRQTDSVKVAVVVTSDKCYENKKWIWPYREGEALGGNDPYSSSKACAEIVTVAYRQSFFSEQALGGRKVGIATARAGNVIGGGDWSAERLVPDVVAAIMSGNNVTLRSLTATRPWQHVLEPLCGYLMLAERLWAEPEKYSGAWNFGPREESNQSVTWVTEQLIRLWGSSSSWVPDPNRNPHEDLFLKLDSSKSNLMLEWTPRLTLNETLQWIVDWYREYTAHGEDGVRQVSRNQIQRYEALLEAAKG